MLRAVFTRGRRLCNGKASHEFTEAITDPELNAWFTAQGNEIGDHLCAYDYGLFYNWDGGNANQMWNSASTCCKRSMTITSLQVGP
jgi:hypothetical protein